LESSLEGSNGDGNGDGNGRSITTFARNCRKQPGGRKHFFVLAVLQFPSFFVEFEAEVEVEG